VQQPDRRVWREVQVGSEKGSEKVQKGSEGFKVQGRLKVQIGSKGSGGSVTCAKIAAGGFARGLEEPLQARRRVEEIA
jgi:hypothetical protein